MGARSNRFAVALHALAVIAERKGEPASSDWIAQSIGTNPVVIRRALAPLRDAGLVTSVAGASGGFLLAKPAELIGLNQIWTAVEPGGSLACHEGSEDCPVAAQLPPILAEIGQDMDRALEISLRAWRLSDVTRRLCPEMMALRAQKPL